MHEVDQYIAYEQESVKRIFANGPQMFKTGGEADSDLVAGGSIPALEGFMHLTFVDGKPNYDNIKEFVFTYPKGADGKYSKENNGKWVPASVTMRDLAHTDISGGAAAWAANKNVMTFCSNYMVKCDKGCPTGQHTH